MPAPLRWSALAGIATLVALAALAACAEGTAPPRRAPARGAARGAITLHGDGGRTRSFSAAGARPAIVVRRAPARGRGGPALSLTGAQVTLGAGSATAVDEAGRPWTIVRAAGTDGLPTRIAMYRDGVLQQRSDFRWTSVADGALLARDSARHYAAGALDFTVAYVDDGVTMQWVGGGAARALASLLAPAPAHAQSPLSGPCADHYWEAMRAAAALTAAMLALPPNGSIPLVAFAPVLSAGLRVRDAIEDARACEARQRDGGGKTGREEVM